MQGIKNIFIYKNTYFGIKNACSLVKAFSVFFEYIGLFAKGKPARAK